MKTQLSCKPRAVAPLPASTVRAMACAASVPGARANQRLRRAEPTTVLLCRHGETDWNLEKRFQGHTDIPLNDAGEEQARQIATAVQSIGVVAVWASPLRRAKSTAELIAGPIGAELRVDERLIERDLGLMQGLTSQEVRTRYPEYWRAWTTTGIPFPPESGVELGPEAVRRIESVLFELTDTYPGKTVACVSHGALIRVLLHQAVGTASITKLVVGPGRSWRVLSVNGAQHLGGLRGLGYFGDAEVDAWGASRSTTTVLVCRHGETNWNLARKFQGMEDIPLNASGCEQALLLAETLRSDHQISAVWTSPLLRARETGVAIAAATGLKLHIDDRLRERNLGVLQGRNPAMMDKEYPSVIAAWRAQIPLPDESGAEPSEEVVARLESALYDLAAAYPGKKVAIVLHGAAIRCLLKRAVGQLRIETPKNVSLTTMVVQTRPKKEWSLVQVAGSSHMPEDPPAVPQAKL